MIELKIIGETPSKKNSRINLPNGRSIPNKRYTEWHRDAIAQICHQTHEKAPYNDAIALSIHFTHGDRRRRDSDNGVSSILDLLVDAGILLDDKWEIVQEIHVKNTYEKNNAGCQIVINEL